MAKAVKNKSAKKASDMFHNIMKASVSNNNDIGGQMGSKNWYYYIHYVTNRKYVIRTFPNEVGDKITYTVNLIPILSGEDEKEIAKFDYFPGKNSFDPDEVAKLNAINHGNDNPEI